MRISRAGTLLIVVCTILGGCATTTVSPRAPGCVLMDRIDLANPPPRGTLVRQEPDGSWWTVRCG